MTRATANAETTVSPSSATPAPSANPSKSTNSAPFSSSAPPTRSPWKKRLVATAKFLLFALIVAWIADRLAKDWTEISRYDWRPRPGWLLASGLFYLAAYVPSAFFWRLSIRWLGGAPGVFSAFKAFYVSQLGKYVPGKALVVVIRSALVANANTKASVAAVCVFYETLTMMATGALLSALIVAVYFREHWLYSALALSTAACVGLPLLPPIFVRILSILRVGKNDPTLQERFRALTWRSLFVGVGLTSVLWLFFGLSLWAAIGSIGVAVGSFWPSAHLLVAASALAVVFGFAVAVAPGGLGVREAALTILLIPFFETLLQTPENATFTTSAETLATIVALVQRLVSIVAEVAAVVAFYAVELTVHAVGRLCRR
ncbi:MAG: flippase-like domain-containing protein [Thermoguttaceae bacterium]|nr:flippase-like domain-containing protein [Thermoguttaceae bacterium]